MLRAVVLAPCEFALDPRHGYWSEFLKNNRFHVVELEVCSRSRNWNSQREMFNVGDSIIVYAENEINRSLIPNYLSFLAQDFETSTGAFLAARAMRQLNAVNHLSLENLAVDLVIANDLGGMLLAEFIWGSKGVQIVYDAQEIFTDSYDLLSGESLSESEKKKWIELETYLCQKASRVVTVSPGIATLYRERHHVECTVIPNFVPIRRHLPSRASTSPVKYVFLGRAEPHRGLEELIKLWDFPPEIAVLDMVLPESSYKTYLQKINRRTKRKYCGPKICDSVSPSEIIKKLNSYDVGIIPYNYPYPYSEASPNKLGEYIAAGLAIVASNQDFVASVVNQFGIGLIFTWDEPETFVSAVVSLGSRDRVNAFKSAVVSARNQSLNFDSGFDILFGELTFVDMSLRTESGNVILPFIERGPFLRSCWRWLRRYMRNSIVRNLRFFGPLIKIVGKTSIGRALAK